MKGWRMEDYRTEASGVMIKEILRKFMRYILRAFLFFGFNPYVILSYRFFPRFLRERSEWIKKGGKITNILCILYDYKDSAGTIKNHYFHQDLLVANLINKASPKRHVDVGSRIDGFIANVASYREIEVVNLLPLSDTGHSNIKFIQADMMKPQNLGKTDSLSCLHAIEHFGLGRYSDSINVDGHVIGINHLINLLKDNGTLYISFPIGKSDEVHFNAHRVFHPNSIMEYDKVKEHLVLQRFDYVDDEGNLHLKAGIDSAVDNVKFGCGIYTFLKKTQT
jgi:hypothetical protein